MSAAERPELRNWRTELLDDKARDSRVSMWPFWMERASADELLARALRSPLPRPETYQRPGTNETFQTRRTSCAFGPKGLTYRYAGQTQRAHAWPPGLEALVEKISRTTGGAYNFALCNVYVDGKAQLGWHSDEEPDLVPGAPIASLSLGASRSFYMRLAGHMPLPAGHGAELPAKADHAWELTHGSLLLMAGQVQRYYQHCLPPRPTLRAPRVNFTFRQVRS